MLLRLVWIVVMSADLSLLYQFFPAFHVNNSVDTVEEAFSLEPEAFKAKYGVTKPPLDCPELVFHCLLGKRGATATSKANQLGYLQ